MSLRPGSSERYRAASPTAARSAIRIVQLPSVIPEKKPLPPSTKRPEPKPVAVRRPRLVNWPLVIGAGAAAWLLVGGIIVAGIIVSRSVDVTTEVASVQVAATPAPESPAPEPPAPVQVDAKREATNLVDGAKPSAVLPEAAPKLAFTEERDPRLPPLDAPEEKAGDQPKPFDLAAEPLRKKSQSCGTSIDFLDDPETAFKQSKEDKKVVFLVHVAGNFEDSKFTWNNAEALRVNALANDDVGEYFNQHFTSAFQKVGTFRIVNGNKVGGNVASYFCNSDGSVLHAIAGPVDARTLLKEARWVEETRKRASLECRGDAYKTRIFWRQAHAERLMTESQTPINFQSIPSTMTLDNFATTYLQRAGVGGNHAVFGNRGGLLENQGKVHALLAVYPLAKIEYVYKPVFEKILNERISTAPVDEIEGSGRKR